MLLFFALLKTVTSWLCVQISDSRTALEIKMSPVTVGHEIENEAGLCKSGESLRAEILLSGIVAYSLLSLAFDLGYHGDLTSCIFISVVQDNDCKYS